MILFWWLCVVNYSCWWIFLIVIKKLLLMIICCYRLHGHAMVVCGWCCDGVAIDGIRWCCVASYELWALRVGKCWWNWQMLMKLGVAWVEPGGKRHNCHRQQMLDSRLHSCFMLLCVILCGRWFVSRHHDWYLRHISEYYLQHNTSRLDLLQYPVYIPIRI